MKLFVTFTYPVNDPSAFEIVDTSMMASYIPDVIEAYLQSVIGAGKDPNPARDLEVYEITLTIDVWDDSIKVDSNCGNLWLVAGILMDILRRLDEGTRTSNWTLPKVEVFYEQGVKRAAEICSQVDAERALRSNTEGGA